MPIMMMPSIIINCKKCNYEIEIYNTTLSDEVECGSCGKLNKIHD